MMAICWRLVIKVEEWSSFKEILWYVLDLDARTLEIAISSRHFFPLQSKTSVPRRGEYNVYSTFQSHEPEFDYLKSLEIEEKINKIRWLRRKNPAHFLLSTNDKTIKLWKVSERDKRAEGYNLKDEAGEMKDRGSITGLRVRILAHLIISVMYHLFFSVSLTSPSC